MGCAGRAEPGPAPTTHPALPADQLVMLLEAKKLNSQVESLYVQGKFAEAVPLALQVRDLRRKALGEQHPLYAVSLISQPSEVE